MAVILFSVVLFGSAGATADVLAPPVVTSPGDTNAPGPLLEDPTVRLHWKPVTNATGYRVFVRDLTTNTVDAYDTGPAATSFAATLISGHDYRWNMRALSGTNLGGLSETLYFQIKLTAAYPKITGVSPNPPPAMDGFQVFTVHGTEFRRGCQVILRLKETGEVYRDLKPVYYRYRFITITPYFTSTPGQWSVEVINPGGYSSGEFHFVCLPAETIPAWRWWRSGWPWAWGGLIAFGATGGFWWWTARRRLPQAVARMRHQTQREERERLARDLHDRASADITSLVRLADLTPSESEDLPSEAQARIRKLLLAARDAETAIGDLLWAADPQSERLPQLAARLRVRIRERLQPRDIEPDFSTWPAPVPDRAISAAASSQILYLSHEVLNNVVQHAQATKFTSTLVVEADSLLLGFRDNGRGFQPDSQPTGRRGLANMRARMQKLGGTFQFQSAPAQGTEITVRLPLDHDRGVTP